MSEVAAVIAAAGWVEASLTGAGDEVAAVIARIEAHGPGWLATYGDHPESLRHLTADLIAAVNAERRNMVALDALTDLANR